MSGGREDTFYQPSSDESFALSQRLQYLAEEACSSRFISLIDKYQYNTKLWVVNKSWKARTTIKRVIWKYILQDFSFYLFCIALLRLLNNCYEPTLTCFFQGCWGDGLFAEMKGLDVDTVHAGEHDRKASLPLLVLLGRAGGGATGSYCKEEKAWSTLIYKLHAAPYTYHGGPWARLFVMVKVSRFLLYTRQCDDITDINRCFMFTWKENLLNITETWLRTTQYMWYTGHAH